jgi:tetratricopeptide (TPR) repeat protein
MKKISKIHLTVDIILILAILYACWYFLIRSDDEDVYAKLWNPKTSYTGINIIYPQNNTLFPPEIASPTFSWNENDNSSSSWIVIADIDGKIEYSSELLTTNKWKADSSDWEQLKRLSKEKDLRISILGTNYNKTMPSLPKILAGGSINIRTSKDSVSASIFYRAVPLPFSFAVENLETISWRLGDISSYGKPKTILENMPVCGNCHSFSRDSKVIGMDVDYANDKGSYFISSIKKKTEMTWENIITWNDFKREDGEFTFGLLSQISPDGKYAVSTVKDRSIFVRIPNLSYSQLFFPIKGILAVYDRELKRFRQLPGADDKDYVQSNPTWSPDGKFLLFAKTKVHNIEDIDKYKEAILPIEIAKDFIEGKQGFQYDIYKIPFNGGLGGTAVPLEGAYNNGMSNFFPKISPDGKWVVFTQAKNFMLLQPDSKLYIMPASGGKPRLMNCNLDSMNSWHSWSPNGKWLLFASKGNKKQIQNSTIKNSSKNEDSNPYTQIYLTHIDENGNDSPPILLENLSVPKRAANIPEFVNLKQNEFDKIIEKFVDSDNYATLKGKQKVKQGNLGGAIDDFTKAIMRDSNDAVSWNLRGISRTEQGDYQGAIDDFTQVIKLKSNNFDAYSNRAVAKFNLRNFPEAVADYDFAIKLNPKGSRGYYSRAIAKYNMSNYKGALEDLNKTILLNSKHEKAYYDRGLVKLNLNDFAGAILDYDYHLKINPNDGQAYYERGMAKTQTTKKKDDACKDLKKALDLGIKDAQKLIQEYCK